MSDYDRINALLADYYGGSNALTMPDLNAMADAHGYNRDSLAALYRNWQAQQNPQPSQWASDHPTLAQILHSLLLASSAVRASPAAIYGNPQIVGGTPGYSHPADKWGPAIPAERYSSTGMNTYDWYGMRNAGTGERLPNPYPNYQGHVDPIEAMTRDVAGRIQSGELDIPPSTLYDKAAQQQQERSDMLRMLLGGKRATPSPSNDNE